MSNQNQLNLREYLPIKAGVTKVVVTLLMFAFFQLFAIWVTMEYDGSVGAMASILGFAATYMLYLLFFREGGFDETPLSILKRLWRCNIVGHKLSVSRAVSGEICYVVLPRSKAAFELPEEVSLLVALGGWFHQSRIVNGGGRFVFAPDWGLSDRVGGCRMRSATGRWGNRLHHLLVELYDKGGRVTCNPEVALAIVEHICDSRDIGGFVPGISGVVHYRLSEAKMHNATTTRRLLSTITRTADELADTSRVGRSKEGKRIREELDRVTLEFVAPGGRVHTRISRRLEK